MRAEDGTTQGQGGAVQEGRDGIAAAFALLNPQPDMSAATDTAPSEVNPEVARLQGELETERAETTKLRGTLKEQGWRAELEGKVSDVDAALKLLDPEKHLMASGKIDLEGLMQNFPALYPRGVTGPTAPSGGGGPHGTGPASLETAISSGNVLSINYAFDQELKRS